MQQLGLLLNVLLLALLWGPSFLFIRLGIEEIQPITLVMLRISISALLMLLILRIKKISLPKDRWTWIHCFVMGFIASSAPFIFFGYSLTHIETILSALINGTTPITTIILANLFLKDEGLTLNRVLGVSLGLMGFLFLFLPTILDGKIEGDTLGMFLSFAGATCYAMGMVYAKKFLPKTPQPLVLPTLQMLTSLVYLIPLSLLIDPPFQIMDLSLKGFSAISALAILGTVFAFIIYYHIVIRFGATALSSVTYLLPLFATIFGVLFLEEKLTLNFCFAAILILSGTMVANGLIRFPFLPRKTA